MPEQQRCSECGAHGDPQPVTVLPGGQARVELAVIAPPPDFLKRNISASSRSAGLVTLAQAEAIRRIRGLFPAEPAGPI